MARMLGYCSLASREKQRRRREKERNGTSRDSSFGWRCSRWPGFHTGGRDGNLAPENEFFSPVVPNWTNEDYFIPRSGVFRGTNGFFFKIALAADNCYSLSAYREQLEISAMTQNLG